MPVMWDFWRFIMTNNLRDWFVNIQKQFCFFFLISDWWYFHHLLLFLDANILISGHHMSQSLVIYAYSSHSFSHHPFVIIWIIFDNTWKYMKVHITILHPEMWRVTWNKNVWQHAVNIIRSWELFMWGNHIWKSCET